MIPVRQSTAFETSIGPVLDADGAAFTGAVVGDFQIKKTSGDWAALNGSATATHTAVGNYDIVLTTSDLDTVGVCAIRINDTVNACATLYLQVIEEAVYDAHYAASAPGYVANQPVDLNTIKTQTVACAAPVTVLASVGTAATSTAQTGDNFPLLRGLVHANGTIGATGNDTSHIHLPTLTYGDDEINNKTLAIYDVSEGEWHAKTILDWVNSTKLAEIFGSFPFTPQASTDLFCLLSLVSGDWVIESLNGGIGDIQNRLPAALSGDGLMVSDMVALSGSLTAATNAAAGWAGLIAATGTAQAGGASTITLESGSVSDNDYLNGAVISILSGTGAGQSRQITDYVGGTLVATVDAAWVTQPDSSSVYQVLGRIV